MSVYVFVSVCVCVSVCVFVSLRVPLSLCLSAYKYDHCSLRILAVVNQDADASGRGSSGGRHVHGVDFPEGGEAGGLTVWACNLKDPSENGSIALLFLNTGDTVCSASVLETCSVCDAFCLEAAGVPEGDYYIRDI